MTKKNESPAQRFNHLARSVQSLSKRAKELEQQARKMRDEIELLEIKANAIVANEIGFKPDDLIVDELGVVYRLDEVRPQSLNWRYNRHESITTLTAATEKFSLRGIALHKNGLPRWSQPRGIRGKVKKYEPEVQE